jgi:hypothetical protein
MYRFVCLSALTVLVALVGGKNVSAETFTPVESAPPVIDCVLNDGNATCHGKQGPWPGPYTGVYCHAVLCSITPEETLLCAGNLTQTLYATESEWTTIRAAVKKITAGSGVYAELVGSFSCAKTYQCSGCHFYESSGPISLPSGWYCDSQLSSESNDFPIYSIILENGRNVPCTET